MTHFLFLFLLFPIVCISLLENGGFPCKIRNSMKLDRRFHGQPQGTRPPFEISIVQADNGQPVAEYHLKKLYKVKLVGYVHFRGLLLEPRLATADGHLIGNLRGGQFIESEDWDEYGINFQECNFYKLNDTITHINDDKKFLVEIDWKTEIDVGAVQFMATIASDDNLYWEKWRPRSVFIRPIRQQGVHINDSVFSIESFIEMKVSPSDEKEALDNMGGLPFASVVFSSEENRSQTKSELLEELSSLSSGPVIPLKKVKAGEIDTEKDEEARIVQTTKRMFKKAKPEPGLETDDLHFLNAHTVTQKDFVTEMDPEEICHLIKPCANDGVCIVSKGNYSCECKEGFTGRNCTERDWCVDHRCANQSKCQNNDKNTGFECVCPEGFVGSFCQFECIKDMCKNRGTCVIKSTGQLGCNCSPGWAGAKCDREINECNFKKCQNGANCTDLFNDYSCACKTGWMGKNCDRPCQDVYKSCGLWKREGQCDLMHPHSNFFDYNCAASCGKCISDEKTTKLMIQPLAPILMPFFWLIGEWTAHVKGFRNRTMDFPFDMLNCTEYTERITFSVAEVLVFGTPNINFTSVAFCEKDPSNIHQSQGFLTVRQYAPSGDTAVKASLSTVDNHGVTMIEEGEVHSVRVSMGNFLNLSPNYKVLLSDSKEGFADEMSRTFTRKGNRLMQMFSKTTKGRTLRFSKTYSLTKKYDYL